LQILRKNAQTMVNKLYQMKKHIISSTKDNGRTT
jgi:hypothetical protein